MGKIKIMGKKFILNRKKLNKPSLMPCNSEPCPASRISKSMGKNKELGFLGVLDYVALVEHLGRPCSLSCSSLWPSSGRHVLHERTSFPQSQTTSPISL